MQDGLALGQRVQHRSTDQVTHLAEATIDGKRCRPLNQLQAASIQHRTRVKWLGGGNIELFFRSIHARVLTHAAAQPDGEQGGDRQRNQQCEEQPFCLHASPLHHQQPEVAYAAGGNRQTVRQAQCLRVTDIEFVVGLEARGCMVNGKSVNVHQRLLEPVDD